MNAMNIEFHVNVELCKVLWTKNPLWRDCMTAEQKGHIADSDGLQPDILVRHPNGLSGGLPVAIETEFAPARDVEDDARSRLRKKLSEDDEAMIEQAIAVRMPRGLKDANQPSLMKKLEAVEYEFCVFSLHGEEEGDRNYRRWPEGEKDWIKGDIDDFATFIEQTSLSENQIAKSMKVLDKGVSSAAKTLQDGCKGRADDVLEEIASCLHQKNNMQTLKMAMAILANALSFHESIAGSKGVKALSKLKGKNRKPSKDKILDAWDYIMEKINYFPIFSIASEILEPIPDNIAQDVLKKLVKDVALELVSLGATSQHDFSGRMFQKLIEDRKFLASFYTLPTSATLLAELAVPRLKMAKADWHDEDRITSLRVGDFACGTGALLNAAYGSLLARYRRGGGGRALDFIVE